MTLSQAAAMRAYRNARYHEDRQGWFDALSKWTNFLTIVLGSGTVVAALGSDTFWAVASGFATTLTGAAQLVFDFGVRARVHGDLRKGFASIAADATEPGADPDAINAKMARLYADEPETFHAVNALAFNAAQKAFGRPDSTLMQVGPWQARLRHFLRFDPSDFPDREPMAPA